MKNFKQYLTEAAASNSSTKDSIIRSAKTTINKMNEHLKSFNYRIFPNNFKFENDGSLSYSAEVKDNIGARTNYTVNLSVRGREFKTPEDKIEGLYRKKLGGAMSGSFVLEIKDGNRSTFSGKAGDFGYDMIRAMVKGLDVLPKEVLKKYKEKYI